MLAQIAIAFILSPFLVHTLGDTQYGIWTIAVAFTGYMNLLDLGLTSAVTRYVSKYWASSDFESTNSIASTALALFLVVGIVIVMVSPVMSVLISGIVSVGPELDSVVRALIIVMSFDIAVFVLSGVMKGLFGGLQRYIVINLAQLFSAAFKAILFYVALTRGGGLIEMAYVSLTANVLVVAIFWLVLRRTVPEIRFSLARIKRASFSKIYHYGKYTFVAMLANQLIYYSDAFIIGFFLNAAAVTYYSIPWTLAEYSKKVTLAIAQTYTPAISASDAKDDRSNLTELYFAGSRYVLLISNLLCVGLLVLGGAFIGIWMGPQYRELCQDVLFILVVNLMVYCPQQISYSVLQGLGRQKLYSYASVGVSIINLILSIILVQRYGIIGVALGAAIPQILFQLILVPNLTLRVLGVSYRQYLTRAILPSVLPAIVLAAVLWAIRQYHFPGNYIQLLSMAALGGFLYAIACFVFLLTKQERATVIRVATGRPGPVGS